jgi:RNA polymerase sigma-70 factor (family 1)
VVTENTYEEKQLLLHLTLSSEHAFLAIYKLYSGRLYGKLIKLLKSESQAKELLQEIFIKLWKNRQNIDPEKSFRSYLFKIATNIVYDFFRKKIREKTLQLELSKNRSTQYTHIEEEFMNKEASEVLQRAISLLPPQRQHIFRLCKIAGKSYDEVSHMLHISTSTISDHIVKANHFLKNYFSRGNI